MGKRCGVVMGSFFFFVFWGIFGLVGEEEVARSEEIDGGKGKKITVVRTKLRKQFMKNGDVEPFPVFRPNIQQSCVSCFETNGQNYHLLR